MTSDDQPVSSARPATGPRTGASGGWKAPLVEELQAMLPQYEVLEMLGRGGMGAVYKARQKSLRRLVAIKILPPDVTDDELKFRERFQHEAETMAKLSHPGIVAVHDFGEAGEGLLYFVMEFIAGTDVARRIASEGPLPVDEAARITRAVCDALDYAHRQGVIHRDIKPANVLIDGEGRVKVADFGLAKIAGHSQQSGLTLTNVAMGTQEFAAPEQLTPGAAVDHRADIYSLGVMFYQMLTGDIPRVMFKLPSRCRAEIGTRFDALVCKALESDPAERFQSVAEFWKAVEDATGIHHNRSNEELTSARGRPRRTAALVTSALAGVALIALGGWFFLGHKHGHASVPHVASQLPGPGSISPSPTAGVIKLWDPPKQAPREVAVRWDNAQNALVLGDGNDKGMLNWAQPRSRDAIIRADIRVNPDAQYAQLRLRYNWTEGPGDFYRVQLHGGMIDFSVSEQGKGRQIKQWPLPHAYGADDWARLELRAVGDALTVSIDGKELETIHDATLSGPGSVMIVAQKNGWFRHVEYVPLDRESSPPDTATGKIIDLLPLVDVKRDASNSVWSVAPDGAVRSVRDRKAGRLEFPYTPPAEYDFEIEFTVEDGESGYVMQVLAVPGHWLDWRLLPPPAFGPALDGVEPGNGPRTDGIGKLNRLKPGDRHRSVVEVRKNSLRAVVDGAEIARYDGDFKRLSDPVGVFKLRDTTHVGVGVLDVGLLIHKAVVREVSGTTEAEYFRPLFDGKSLDGWLSLNGVSPPNGWRVVDGTMTGKPFSAVMTREEFGDFELTLEWRVNPQGNGGVFYRVAEDGMVDHPLHAVEFNLMDENISAPPLKHCGAAFDVKAPSQKAARPAEEWNTARLLVQGAKVQQWINDQLVCSYDLADASVRGALETVKIGVGFAAVKKGRIALQDWTGEVFYRNVRIRDLR